MEVTWYGHAFFKLETENDKIYVDPFIEGNELCPIEVDEIKSADYVTVTHGHDDHYGQAVKICKNTGATLVANYEITVDASEQGVSDVEPMNIGGSVSGEEVKFHMTEALHSSGALGHQCGFVIETPELNVYHAGDTGLFSDMELIGEMLEPELALLPIGDRFTMGPPSASRAVEMLGVSQVIPMHYNTFEPISQDPEKFKKLVGYEAEVIVLQPGQTHFSRGIE